MCTNYLKICYSNELALMAEQCSGVSPLWFRLETFLALLVLAAVAVGLSGPSGTRGGDTRLGLQSEHISVTPPFTISYSSMSLSYSDTI